MPSEPSDAASITAKPPHAASPTNANIRVRRAVPVLIAVASLLAATAFKDRILEAEFERRYALPALVPNETGMRVLTFGMTAFAADAIWLRVLEYFGDKRYLKTKYPAAAPLMELATDLDPEHCNIYERAGYILTSDQAENLAACEALMLKGIRACPNNGYLPFIHGFNLFFFQKRYKDASEYLLQAARDPRATDVVRDLAARVSSSGGALDAAETAVEAMLESAADDTTKAQLAARLQRIHHEQHMQAIEAAITRAKQAGAASESVDALVKGGFLTPLPSNPDGGEYSIKNGEVTCTTMPERLRLRHTGAPPSSAPTPATP